MVGAFAKDRDPRYFKSVKVRFAKSVFPGDTLVTEMWKESDTRVVFRTSVKERSEVVLTSAAVELYTEIPKPKPKAQVQAAEKTGAAPTQPISADIFAAIGAFLAKSSETVAKVGKVFQFKLSGPDSVWTVDVKGASGCSQGETSKPDCTLEMSDADFMDMCTGKADVHNDVVLGTGVIDWPSLLREAARSGVKWYFIEDESDAVAQQIPQSLRFLEQVKW